MTLEILKLRRLLLVALCALLASRSAWASPSGLNNIPTTDYTPPSILVLQSWTNLTDDLDPELYTGFKYGLLEGLEVGLDWKTDPDPHSHGTFQGKYTFDLAGDEWKGVVGIANLSAHRAHQGHVFPYVATSYDFEVLRGHLGYTSQRNNEGFFAGIDKTVSFLNRDLQLKADAIQVNHMDDVLYSAGFLYDLRPPAESRDSTRTGLAGVWDVLTRDLILESWVTEPTTGKAALTVKLNYVIKF